VLTYLNGSNVRTHFHWKWFTPFLPKFKDMDTIWIVFGIIVISLSIYAMISVVISKMDTNRKILWFIIVAMLPIVGPLAYYSVAPQKR
jgi:hypothetical protein